MQPTLVILAAGMGSRYGGLKQLDPVGPSGETIMDYSVHDAIRAGFGRIVFVIREAFAEAFQARVADAYGRRIDVQYAFQDLADLPDGFSVPAGRDKPWGTAHAVLSARHIVDGPFAVINADDFYGADSFAVLARWLETPAPSASTVDPVAMVGFTLHKTLSPHGSVCRGICSLDADGRLAGIEEIVAIRPGDGGGATGQDAGGNKRELTGTETVSMNMWGFPTALFPRLECAFVDFLTRHGGALKSEFFLPEVVNTLMHAGRVTVDVLPTSGDWFGVTYQEDRPLVREAIRKLVEQEHYPPVLFD